jgi:hypothetical protein
MRKTIDLHPDGQYRPSGDALPWFTGALGEIAVAGVLAQLGSEWTVLHSVPVGKNEADIDHVVIGPSGVFTINSKNHSGQRIWIAGRGLFVGGHSTNYISSALGEAARAESQLSNFAGLNVPVSPMIVFVNPGPRTVKSPPEGRVRVLSDRELLSALEGPRVFSDDQLHRIVSVAVRPGTWHDKPLQTQDSQDLAVRFNAIMARTLQGAASAPSTAGRSTPRVRAMRSEPPRRTSSSSRQRSRSRGPGFIEQLVRLGLGMAFLYFFLVVLLPMITSSMLSR